MSSIRRDALGSNGVYRYIRTHCDGAFRTDAGPCGCGPASQCWLIVLACGCENLNEAVAIDRDSPGLELAWPYADRRAGVVASIGGVCYRFVAAMSERPPQMAQLDWAGFGQTYASCDVSPCDTQPPCACDSGFAINLLDVVSGTPGSSYACTTPLAACGIERIGVELRGAARSRQFIDDLGSAGAYNTSSTVMVEAAGELTGTGAASAVAMSGTGRSVGFDEDRGTAWDWTQSYEPGNGEAVSGLVSQGITLSTLPGVTMLDDDLDRPPFAQASVGIGQGEADRVDGCDLFTFEDEVTLVETRTRVTLSLLSTTVVIHDETTAWLDADRDRVIFRQTREITKVARRRITLTSGVVLADEDCDRPLSLLAGACDPATEPAVIACDAELVPAWATAVIDPMSGALYTLTGNTSEDTPAVVLASTQVCDATPEQWPVARECNGTRTLTYDPADRPGDGVTLLVGPVRYAPINAARVEAPTAGVWTVDGCPPAGLCADLAVNDPRCANPLYAECPQCVGFDIGDPQPEPDFDVQTDPRARAIIEAQQRYGVNQPGRCQGCGQ